MVKNINIINTKTKNKITDFCKDKLNNNFIKLSYRLLIKGQTFLVRLLGFEPRTSWSVAKRSIQLSYRRKYVLHFFFLLNFHAINN